VSAQEERLKSLEEVTAELRESQKILMELVEKISKDTSEIVGAWNDTKAAFRLFNILVSFFWGIMKYVVLPILVLIALVYGLGHTGEVPSWLKNAVKLILG
jgi:hypothetical protein